MKLRGKVLIAASSFGEFNKDSFKLLKKNSFSYILNPFKRRLTTEEIVQLGKDCEGVIAGAEHYTDDVLESMPKLQCISRCGVGIDNISLDKAREKNIKICNTPDVVTQPVAELTLAMMLDLLKKLTSQTILLKAHQWERKLGNLLMGKTVGIIGLGRIGKRVVELLRPFNVNIYGLDLYPDKKWAQNNGVKMASLQELLPICDIISLHVSVLKNGSFQLGKKEFSSMKRGSMIINVSRGQCIDENALYAALKNGHLGGAALDVFSKEPYSGKLCELDNVILTPHIGTFTLESRSQMELEATQNLINFLKK